MPKTLVVKYDPSDLKGNTEALRQLFIQYKEEHFKGKSGYELEMMFEGVRQPTLCMITNNTFYKHNLDPNGRLIKDNEPMLSSRLTTIMSMFAKFGCTVKIKLEDGTEFPFKNQAPIREFVSNFLKNDARTQMTISGMTGVNQSIISCLKNNKDNLKTKRINLNCMFKLLHILQSPVTIEIEEHV